MVEGAPNEAGLYALWEDDELIYVGRASATSTIRQRLTEHLERSSSCTQRATHYSWELSLRPAAREAEILEQHRARFGRLPRCNVGAA